MYLLGKDVRAVKRNRGKIHLLSMAILAAGLGLSILIQPEPGGYVRLAMGIAMVSLIFILCSLFLNGKLVPLITASGYFLTFLFAYFFQQDGLAGPGSNNFGRLWIISFSIVFVVSLYFESVYANKKLYN